MCVCVRAIRGRRDGCSCYWCASRALLLRLLLIVPVASLIVIIITQLLFDVATRARARDLNENGSHGCRVLVVALLAELAMSVQDALLARSSYRARAQQAPSLWAVESAYGNARRAVTIITIDGCGCRCARGATCYVADTQQVAHTHTHTENAHNDTKNKKKEAKQRRWPKVAATLTCAHTAPNRPVECVRERERARARLCVHAHLSVPQWHPPRLFYVLLVRVTGCVGRCTRSDDRSAHVVVINYIARDTQCNSSSSNSSSRSTSKAVRPAERFAIHARAHTGKQAT